MSERRKALIEAAEFVEFYGEERLRLAGDAILHDPLLSGGRFTAANIAKSRELTIDGCVDSAGYHAAVHIAERLRQMADEAPGAAQTEATAHDE